MKRAHKWNHEHSPKAIEVIISIAWSKQNPTRTNIFTLSGDMLFCSSSFFHLMLFQTIILVSALPSTSSLYMKKKKKTATAATATADIVARVTVNSKIRN